MGLSMTKSSKNHRKSGLESSVNNRKSLSMQRLFTRAGVSPYDVVQWDHRSSVISDPNGSVVFKMDDVEVPKSW
mgnify:FL=1